MESHASGELYWDITAATPPRWIVWLYQPGADPRRLDLRDPSIPQYAPASQLMELISEALCEAMGQRLKVMVDLSLDEPGQRYRFWVTYLSSPDRSTDQQALGGRAMRITWDPAKAAENLRWHRVRFAEAGEVLRDPFALTREDPRQDEQRFVTLGATLTGKLLVVVYAYEGDEDIQLISAREASRAERRHYADEPR